MKNPLETPRSFLLYIYFIFISIGFAQEEVRQKEAIKLFVDCNCERSYIRQEINFVSHVRDQALANVKLFIYDIANGSGGRTYKLDYLGTDGFADIVNKQSYDTNSNMTADDIRKGLVKTIKSGLLQYVAASDLADKIIYKISDEGLAKRQDIDFEDPWNNWLFEVRGEARMNKESSRNSFRYEAGFVSDRVTEKWRIRANIEISQANSKYVQDEEEFISKRKRYFGNGSIVRSLTDHWSAGVFGSARYDTYTNLDLALRMTPALEYNIFPYREVLRREITFAYKIGLVHNDYIETTIFGEDTETLFSHSLDVQARFRQPWGNMYSRLIGSTFLSDFSKNRVQFDCSVSMRVLKGLAVRFSGNMKLIQDQINLPAGDASLEDVLLQQKQIATNFVTGFSVGLSYTFGSAFNNIINTRL
ncbi:hypothetical protein [uncultured Kriegella sp.]|uniref:hypothetical protein n=1 Tax=uncultured Kriegella sp. TaxID=1798910 RepID=UPI0030DBB54C|tara:strand:+ start:14477 stop:15730 length:1254 start_codon:yes stop_codon:yes gene_type:complete